MNQTQLVGRLVKDAFINEKGKIARFTIAVRRNYKNKDGDYESDFIPCVTFNDKVIKFIKEYIKKGTLVSVCGSVLTSNYTDRDGNMVYTSDILVNTLNKLSKD